jgi:arylsulfatase A-like enzyme
MSSKPALRLQSIFLSLCLFVGIALSAQAKPNVVMIIVDDLNDLPLHPEFRPQAVTPNIDRLADSGMRFNNAHTNDPICEPSRSSMLFGLYPQTSGLYWFEHSEKNEILNNSVPLHEHLQASGYGVFGTGKVFHSVRRNPTFDKWGYNLDYGPWPWDGRDSNRWGYLPHPAQKDFLAAASDVPYDWEHCFGPIEMIPDWPADAANGVPGYKGWLLYTEPWKFEIGGERDLFPDELSAQWSAELLKESHDGPFALFIGLTKTHTPLYAPQSYFDRFPLESIEVPSDWGLKDMHLSDIEDTRLYGFRRFQMLQEFGGDLLVKKWIQAYLACLAFVDDQVGVILDAIDAGPHKDNTVVILTSDHGFHMGDRDYLYKGSLWETSTRVPLIISGFEGMDQGVESRVPVSLIDIYPTFIDLCELPAEPNQEKSNYPMDGHSLLPLLKQSTASEWAGPPVAITAIPGEDHMHLENRSGVAYPHFSVKSEDWRYILTSSSQEALYHTKEDVYEQFDLSNDPQYAIKKAELKAELIKLRDGDRWQSLMNEEDWKITDQAEAIAWNPNRIEVSPTMGTFLQSPHGYQSFEIEFELKTLRSLEFAKGAERHALPKGSIESIFGLIAFSDTDWESLPDSRARKPLPTLAEQPPLHR